MKTLKTVLLLFALSIVCFLLGGCATFQRKFFTEEQSLVPVVSSVPASTNYVMLGTNVVEVITPESLVTNYVTNTVWNVRPSVAATIEGAKTANRMLNPTPTGPLVELGLSAALLALGWFAKRKNDFAKERGELLPVLIKAIEDRGTQELKDAVLKLSLQSGLSDKLHKLVKKNTT